jgi:hypothetical protein
VLASLAGIAAIGWLFYAAERRGLAAQARAGIGPFALSAVRLSPGAVRVESPYGVSVSAWAHYGRYRIARETLLLYFRTGTRALVLPRSLFGDRQWHEATALAAAKLPEG